jgi:hypothetical protein
MRYICLGYLHETTWNAMSQGERDAFTAECLAFGAQLRAERFVGNAAAIQNAWETATLRCRGGKMFINEGPIAETREHLSEILVLEARDLNHALQLMATHPTVRRGGCCEVRPSA